MAFRFSNYKGGPFLWGNSPYAAAQFVPQLCVELLLERSV